MKVSFGDVIFLGGRCLPGKRHGHPHCFNAPVNVPYITSRGCEMPEAGIHQRENKFILNMAGERVA